MSTIGGRTIKNTELTCKTAYKVGKEGFKTCNNCKNINQKGEYHWADEGGIMGSGISEELCCPWADKNRQGINVIKIQTGFRKKEHMKSERAKFGSHCHINASDPESSAYMFPRRAQAMAALWNKHFHHCIIKHCSQSWISTA